MMPRITRPQVYRVVREMLPRERFGPAELLQWLEETQDSTRAGQALSCQAPRRLRSRRLRPPSLTVVVILAACPRKVVVETFLGMMGRASNQRSRR